MMVVNIEQIGKNIYRIPVPIPFPMKYIYCYMVRGADGWSLVDAGFHNTEAIEAWEQVLKQMNVRYEQIHSIYFTHFHPDHFGLAGWMQERTGAKAYISKEDFAMAQRVWGKNSSQAEQIGEMCRKNGTPEDLADEIEESMRSLAKHVTFPELTILEDDEVILGERKWEVIPTPGHSDGHICFYQREERLLLAADHILDKITPNISIWPGSSKNPLGNYISSLEKIQQLKVDLALPAHGALIERVDDRISEIIQHHQKRLDQIFRLAKDGRTAYDIAQDLFQHKSLNSHQWRFAIAETLSHLEYLVFTGQIKKENRNDIVFYKQNK
ncbi:MBL fold metallo-hydrolase [Aeribacillus pallidus]|nr:MBL fold metallo-hydrolase [Aeribacillus composti]KZM53691.1 MBL fold metallo-hydrolase [Aeribacillus pallidus]MED0652467.1 MBL fold metallo-hydrolase [Aeribacillus composti]MED0716908.1 MBL fold metallo-hydrolase [Aeribacillus composti]MED0747609.1 MBL fold metallo-hydrolase [Aeribacillus composti]MED4488801.1 MBL fold metallo-hydrolase [Aeribacillus pallidus]